MSKSSRLSFSSSLTATGFGRARPWLTYRQGILAGAGGMYGLALTAHVMNIIRRDNENGLNMGPVSPDDDGLELPAKLPVKMRRF